jgi:hypothetical protein
MISLPDTHRDEISVHNPMSQRLDAKLIARLYGVSVSRLAKWLDVKYNTIKKTSDSLTIQPALAKLVDAFEQLQVALVTQRAVREWLNHPLPQQELTPISILDRDGALDEFYNFVERQMRQNCVHD